MDRFWHLDSSDLAGVFLGIKKGKRVFVSLDKDDFQSQYEDRLEGISNHLIPHLAEKLTAKEMWDALKGLYEKKNKNKKMALRDNLHNTRMAKGENVALGQLASATWHPQVILCLTLR
jgi:hypothetical protein